MASTTQIEWTDATWNPVTGCTKITRGCDFCYAERFSERFRGVKGHPFERGFDLMLRPERLEQPLAWRQPRRIFVNSMSDLFHKEVPRHFIDAVFDTMEAANWHTFQILTKRSSLMARYLRARYGAGMFANHQAEVREATIDEIVTEQKLLAADRLVQALSQRGPLKFTRVVSGLLEAFMLRETNVKDICVDLAKSNKIENTWGSGNRKPRDDDTIMLVQR